MEYENLDELLKAKGFENEDEFNRLISNVDLTDSCNLLNFNIWKEKDGTKSGLLKVMEDEGTL